MKKRWILILATMLVLTLGLTLAGCGSGDSGEAAADDTSAAEAQPEETAEPGDGLADQLSVFDSGDSGEATADDTAVEEAQAEEAAEPGDELADQLEIVYEKAYNEKTPSLDLQHAMMLMAVKNNSDKTLDVEFTDTGVDKDGNLVSCDSYGLYVQKAIAPGETRWFTQIMTVAGDDVDNIDHMSGGTNAERFKVTESEETSFSDQVELSGMQAFDDGITGIMGTNNSDQTGKIDAWFLFKKGGEPVYFASVAICNLKDGEIAFLEPGESTDAPTYVSCGGNEYDDYEYFVVANTGKYE